MYGDIMYDQSMKLSTTARTPKIHNNNEGSWVKKSILYMATQVWRGLNDINHSSIIAMKDLRSSYGELHV